MHEGVISRSMMLFVVCSFLVASLKPFRTSNSESRRLRAIKVCASYFTVLKSSVHTTTITTSTVQCRDIANVVDLVTMKRGK